MSETLRKIGWNLGLRSTLKKRCISLDDAAKLAENVCFGSNKQKFSEYQMWA